MSSRRARLRALALALPLLISRVADAAPNVWQRLREPRAAEQQRTLNRVERLLSSLGLPEFDAELSAGAIALAQLGHGRFPCIEGSAWQSTAHSAPDIALDPRLEYLLGSALLDSQNGREAEARCMLERALRDAPESPLAARGWSDLAIAAAKLGDRLAEHDAYQRALELTWDPDSRGNLLANLAESDMALGDLPRAVRGYRASLQNAQKPDLIAGAYFGLAVALDRSGDLPSALRAAERAISVPLPAVQSAVASVLDLPNVFFTPSYEVHYYKALGAMAAAELVKDRAARRDALADAAEQWTRYLLGAELDHAPWAERASLHLAGVRRKLDELGATTDPKPKAPPAPPPLL